MSKYHVKITIGICAKNAEKNIGNCIQSIANQTYPKELMHLVVVDGKSNDKTIEVGKQVVLASKLSSNFLSDDGRGLGKARQLVFDISSTRYVLFVDSDVLLLSNFVETQVEFMEKNPNISVATGRHIIRKYSSMNLPASLESIDKFVSTRESASSIGRGIPPNDVSIYRAEASKQVGGFDINITGACEDVDIITRMRKMNWSLGINENAGYYVVPKATWSGLWVENVWFGYGAHLLGHKHKELHLGSYSIPIVYFYVGLKKGLKAYKLTLEKKSFIFPFSYFFSKVGWWYGFVQAHLNGYGHKE